MIRVGFFLNVSGQIWLGGTSYFRNLLTALADLPERKIQTVLLTGSNSGPELLAELPLAEWHCLPSLRRFSPRWIARKLLADLSDTERLLERDLQALNIDALSHSGHLGPGARIPTLAWIADFQHLRQPQNFSAGQRRSRDRHYARLCRYASRIILSSHSASKDLANFFPAAIPKVRILQFVANVPDPESLLPLEALKRKYAFSDRYFFLPNQFWVHKNHRVVLDALSLLRLRGRPLTVLASGKPADDRDPGHFSRLMRHAEALGVAAQFRVLGLVPNADLVALMWHSVAVINPSRFEGWSTTVEEAKSLGVPAIVSDIDVHREQRPPSGAYFEPDDAEKLAELMWRQWNADGLESRHDLAEQARGQLAGRRAQFARQFESYVLECVAQRQDPGR